jgi:hypothetical protein
LLRQTTCRVRPWFQSAGVCRRRPAGVCGNARNSQGGEIPGQARSSRSRKRTIKALTLHAPGLARFGNVGGLRNVAKSDRQNARFIAIPEGRPSRTSRRTADFARGRRRGQNQKTHGPGPFVPAAQRPVIEFSGSHFQRSFPAAPSALPQGRSMRVPCESSPAGG